MYEVSMDNGVRVTLEQPIGPAPVGVYVAFVIGHRNA
jgi:hypothetical protein